MCQQKSVMSYRELESVFPPTFHEDLYKKKEVSREEENPNIVQHCVKCIVRDYRPISIN